MFGKLTPKTKIYMKRFITNTILSNLAILISISLPFGVIRAPADLTIDRFGHLYMSDTVLDKIQQFDARGNVVAEHGEGKNLLTKFADHDQSMYRLTTDEAGNIYGSNESGSELKKYSPDGKLLKKWFTDRPFWQVLVDSKNDVVFVVSNVTPYINKYNLDGKLLLSWGSKETFGFGPYIALNSKGEILAASSETNMLYSFDQNGNLLHSWSTPDVAWKSRIAVDQADNLYVGNSAYGIQKINPQGQLIKTWQVTGNPEPNKDNWAKRIVVNQNDLYVLFFDRIVNKIKHFDLNGQFLNEWNVSFPIWSIALIVIIMPCWFSVFPLLVKKVGRREESELWLENIREPLPEWVQEAKFKPRILKDHLNSPLSEKRIQNPSVFIPQNIVAQISFILAHMLLNILIIGLLGFEFAVSLSFGLGWLILASLLLLDIVVIILKVRNYNQQTLTASESKTPVEKLLGQVLSTLPQSNDTTLLLQLPAINSPNPLVSMLPQLFFATVAVSLLNDEPEKWFNQYIVLGGITLVIMVGLWLLNAITRPKMGKVKLTQAEIGSLFGYIGLCVAAFVALGVALDLVGIVLAPYIKDIFLLSWTPTIFGVAKYGLLFFSLLLVPYWWVFGKLNTADYEAALRRVAYLTSLWGAVIMRNLYVGTLRYANRVSEAEYMIQRELINPDLQQPHIIANFLEQLGLMRMNQGRYAESLFLLESAIELNPASSHTYSNLGEVYLWLHQQPARALELIEHAQLIQTKGWLISLIQPHINADKIINQAWAYAQLGQMVQADSLIEKAFKAADAKHKPGLASLHRRAGNIMLLRGDTVKANEHYRQVLQLDPNGIHATQVRELLLATK